MSPNKENINPFADLAGAPINGKEVEFYDWAEKRRLEILMALSPEDRIAKIEAQRRLSDHMNS